ncbi:unnamed protein product [Paramecium primaurelia]|uniref:Transmembrane protein n=1 Tax=Paramecium primaurelia TaxID=5886 RepID=A0A8S1JMG0_PARPR|nr:unnamed protein product [Paramecium primaurelia]
MPQFLQTTQNLVLKFRDVAIDQLDIFGQPPNFRVLNKQKYNSMVGLITTILIGGVTLIYLTNELVTMLGKAEPSVVSSEIQVFDTQTFPLLNDNFTLAISATNSAGNQLNGQGIYYNISIFHCIRSRNKNETTGLVVVTVQCSLLPTETCNMSHFVTEQQNDYFSRMRLGAMQCINREYLKLNPPPLQGQLNAMVYQYLKIQLTVCHNSTEYQKCASPEEIKSILMSGHYVVYTSDYLTQLNNPSEPYKQIINSEFSGFSVSTSKIIKQYFRIIETTSDDGWLLQNIHVKENLKQQEWRETTELYNEEYIVEHYIALDYRQTNYNRNYVKIQTVLSRLGGIWQIFIIIVASIIRPIVNTLMNLDIANKVFRFQLLEDEKDLKTKNNSQLTETKMNDDKITIYNWKCQNHKLSSNISSKMFILFGCKNQKKLLFNNAKNQIMQSLDIINLIKKLQEIDLIKQIIFTKEQQLLFNIIPNPLIQLNNDLENNNLKINNIDFIKHINQISQHNNKYYTYLESYHKMINTKDKNLFDEKIIQLLDKQTLTFFDKQIGQMNVSQISKSPAFLESKDEDINEPIPLLPK